MDSKKFSIGFSEHYPKYDEKNHLALELCPVLTRRVRIGGYFCLQKCKNLNNSEYKKNITSIICIELNKYKFKKQKS